MSDKIITLNDHRKGTAGSRDEEPTRRGWAASFFVYRGCDPPPGGLGIAPITRVRLKPSWSARASCRGSIQILLTMRS
jgi:hypothetical protein